MRRIEDYLEEADALAQEVVDRWADNLREGNAHSLGDDFKVLFDKAFEYREARIVVDSHRELNILTPTEAVNEQTSRQVFAELYKIYWENSKVASTG
jgi:hypothetical protein